MVYVIGMYSILEIVRAIQDSTHESLQDKRLALRLPVFITVTVIRRYVLPIVLIKIIS